jgi:hypothetical protein
MRFLSKNKANREDSGDGKGGSGGSAAIKGGKVTKGSRSRNQHMGHAGGVHEHDDRRSGDRRGLGNLSG